jgi:predicted HTH domain antitoxin
MQTVNVEIPKELVSAAGFDTDNLSAETVRLLALELHREDKVSLRRAAELCEMPVEQFMEFAAQRNVPLHYGVDELNEDRRTLEQLGLCSSFPTPPRWSPLARIGRLNLLASFYKRILIPAEVHHEVTVS